MKNTSDGFAIPTIIVTATALLIVSLALLQSVSSVRSASLDQYYTKIAEEAAEAGGIYATSCLERNNRQQTWGPTDYLGATRPVLTQDTACDGSDYQPGTSVLVANDDRIKTEFSVGNLEYVSSNATQVNSVQIVSRGYAKIKFGSSGLTTKTYEVTIKKTISWAANLNAEKSASGTLRTCGVLSASVYCWGSNSSGQLGNGTTTDSTIPVKVQRLTYPGGIGSYKVLSMVAGDSTNCMIIETNEVYCWGENGAGQMGRGNTTDSSTPIRVQGLLAGKTISKLGAGGDVFCAITSAPVNGDLYCWGKNTNGQIGIGNTTSPQSSPVLVAGPSKTSGGGAIGTKVVTGINPSGAFNDNICAIAYTTTPADAKAYCWGLNTYGQLGDNSVTQRTSPVAVNTTNGTSDLYNKTVVAISSEGNVSNTSTHTCAVAYTSVITDAKAYCWGSNVDGQIGNNGAKTPSSSWPRVPKAVSTSGVLSGKTVTEVAVNNPGSCVIAYPTAGSIEDSRAYCWGSTISRGDGVNADSVVPVAVTSVPAANFASNKIYSIVGGANRICALANNKSYCWGSNGVGQIGDGTTVQRKQPTEALFLRPKNNEYLY